MRVRAPMILKPQRLLRESKIAQPEGQSSARKWAQCAAFAPGGAPRPAKPLPMAAT